MIVNRRTFNVKPDQVNAAVEWLQTEIAAEQARGPLHGTYRIYVSSIGTFAQVAFESEYDDLATYEQFWATWFSRPECQEANRQFITLLRGGGTNSIWRLVE
jgi:hypothetical protein